MKHINKFKMNEKKSDNIQKYNIGNYVKLKAIIFIDNIPRYTKIIKIDPTVNGYYYLCNDPNNKTIWVQNDEIERELTPVEIEKYELDSNINKFNL